MRRLLLLPFVIPVSALAQTPSAQATDPNVSGWSDLPGPKLTAPPPPPTEDGLSTPPPPPMLDTAPAPGEEAPAPSPSRLSADDDAPPPTVPAAPAFPTPAVPAPPKLHPNVISLGSAATLGPRSVGASLSLGFPLLSARVGYGIAPMFDGGIGLDSFYGVMNEPRIWLRFCPFGEMEGVSLAITGEAGAAFFLLDPNADLHGARFLTGRRNYNLVPGVRLGLGGDDVRSTRWVFTAEYLVAFDTQPISEQPLGGLKSGSEVLTSLLFQLGAEFPISEGTAFTMRVGFDVHGGASDSAFMPTLSLGMVTGL